MKPINILYYAVALIFPILLFTVFTPNTNETHPLYVWIVCPILFAIAGYLSSIGKLTVDDEPTNKAKWVGWSVFVGLVEAAILVFAA